MVKNRSLKAKLLTQCIMLACISVIVGTIGYVGLSRVSEQYGFITEKSVPKIELANKMFLEYRRVRITLRTLGLPGLPQEQADNAVKEATESINQFEESKNAYAALGFIPGQKELFEKMDASWTDFKATGAQVISLHRTGTPENLAKMMDIFFNDCPQKAKVFTAAANDILNFHAAVIDKKTLEAKASANLANNLSLWSILIGLAVGMGFGYMLATSLTKTLGEIIQKLSDNALQVSSASTQIASSSEQLSQSSTEQASSLEQTAASLEEINSMISKAAENTTATATNSSRSQDKAEEGRMAVDQMLKSMNDISISNDAIMVQVNESNQQMTEIVKVIQEIGTKTKVINDIVFQTKLLSFNASVEAARAGEHGKGFAVVAEEVGNLAQMSGNAAKEISDMLASSISKVEMIVEQTKTKVDALINQGKEKVHTGTGVANQCSEMLDDILQNVSKVSSLAQEISQASKEQAQGVTEINKAMGQLDTVTQQNSSTSEQVANAANDLSNQATLLKSVVDELTSVIHGGAAITAAVAVVPAKNVVHMKKTASQQPSAPTLRAAAGDPIPSSDNMGFRDI